jgi:hypothetical protein
MIAKANGNDYDDGGDTGGLTSPKPIRVGNHLNYLRRLIETGDETPDALVQAETFCRNLLDDEDATSRDKNNASKTLATIAKLRADVALGLDKIDRLDDGRPTEHVVTLELEFDDMG